jgi:SAM-dependent methyltransferase
MPKTNNPEINVEELMQRIRAEVSQRKVVSNSAESRMAVDSPRFAAVVGNTSGEELPAFTLNLPELPPFAVQPVFQSKAEGHYHVNDLLCYHDQAFVNVAYRTVLHRSTDTDGYLHYLNMLRKGCAKIDILGRLRYSKEGRAAGIKISGLALAFLLQQVYRIPVFGRFVQILSAIWHLPHLERNQRTFENHAILLIEQVQRQFSESCRTLNKSLVQLEQGIRHLQDFASPRAHQAAINETTVENFSRIQKSLEELQNAKANQSALDEARNLFTHAIETRAERHELTALTNHLVSLVEVRLKKEDLQPVERLLDQLKQHIEELNRSKAAHSAFEAEQTKTRSALAALQQNVQQALNAAKNLQDSKTNQDDLNTAIGKIQLYIKEAVFELQNTKANQSALDEALLRLKAQTHDIKRNLLDQDRRLGLLLEEARKRLPEPISREQIETMLTEDDHRLDAMYASFEDQFRGTREDIKQRQSIYLPIVLEAKAGTKGAPILDLGCGRGEWLEFLRDEGLIARGVDINRIFLEGCRELELEVVEQDAVEYLRTLKPNSIGAVTAFHLIEHLPLKNLIALMDESLRVLQPGGIAIFETPNPENLQVGACGFYTDPTHRNPMPPHLTKILMEFRGFVRPVIVRYNLEQLRQYAPPMMPNSQPGAASINPMVDVMRNNFYVSPDYAVVAYKA